MLETMRPLVDFLPLIVTHTPEAPEPLILQALRLSAVDYCKRMKVWRHTVQVAVDADGEDPVVAPDYTSIYMIETAHFGDDLIALTPIAYTDIDQDWMLDGETGEPPQYIAMTSRNTVTVLPIATGALHLSVFLTPISGPADTLGRDVGDLSDPYDAVNQVPNFLFVESAEAIANGALARLFRIPNKPWTDFNLATGYLQLFNDATEVVLTPNVTGKHRARRRAKPHWF